MQSTSEYEFRYYNPQGEYLFSLTDNYYSAQYWVSEREVGSFFIDIPHHIGREIFEYLELDSIVEIYRSYRGEKTLMFNKRWFLRLWRDKIDENRQKYMRLRFVGCNNIIDRRIVYYNPETSQVVVDNEAPDDAIKRLARENFGSQALAYRDLSSYIDIEPDASIGTPISMGAFSRVKLMTVFENICTTAYARNEEYVTFDMRWQPETQKYKFQTYVGQLGTDRGATSNNTLYLTAIDDDISAFGGLNYASISLDGTDSRTAIYCGGMNVGDDRIIVEEYDNDEINRTPFGLWEAWVDARNVGTEANVEYKAEETLESRKAKLVVNGHMSGAFVRHLGIDFDWGDIVAFKFKNNVYDVHINKVQFNLEADGEEEIKIFTRNLEDTYY